MVGVVAMVMVTRAVIVVLVWVVGVGVGRVPRVEVIVLTNVLAG